MKEEVGPRHVKGSRSGKRKRMAALAREKEFLEMQKASQAAKKEEGDVEGETC